MKFSSILRSCVIAPILMVCVLTACDSQDNPQHSDVKVAPVTVTPHSSSAAETDAAESDGSKPALSKPTRPALDLSIDSIELDGHDHDDIANSNGLPGSGNVSPEPPNALFDTLNSKQSESGVSVSGKLYTDEERLDNKEYLKSVEGGQINIEGSY